MKPKYLQAALAVICLVLMGAALAGSMSYQYDELGRLVQTTDSLGNVVQYSYDSTGNILQITRSTTTVLSIVNVAPDAAAVGATVIIEGTGFSATASNNQVLFNGVAATVMGATTTQLTVAVPSGATTGPISVTSGGNTVSSPSTFAVVSSTQPTLSSFTPGSAAVGATVTLAGSNFSPVAVNNQITFGGSEVITPQSASTTQLVVTVPATAGSGHISVTTPSGTATSASDFVVQPAATSSCTVSSSVGASARSALNASPATLSIPAGQGGVLLFDAAQGQYLTLDISSMSMASTNVMVTDPRGNVLQCGTITSAPGGLQLPPLSQTGTYAVVVTPSAAGSVSLAVQTPISGQLTLGAAPQTVTFTAPAQRALYSFSGTAGETVNLTASGITLPGGTLTIFTPDGTVLESAPLTAGGSSLLSPALPFTGTYTVLVDPSTLASGALSLQLLSVPPATLSVNGPTTNVALTGATTTATFDASQGQWLTLAAAASATGSSYSATLTVLSPAGVAVGNPVTLSSSTGAASSVSLNTGALLQSGRYSVVVSQPSSGFTGPIALTLSQPINGGTLTTTSPLTLGAGKLAGQGEQMVFNAQAGEQVTLNVTHTDTAGTYNATASILDPSGNILGTVAVNASPTGSAGLSNIAIPISGRYTVLLQQNGASATGSETFSLSGPLDGSLMSINSRLTSSVASLGGTTRIEFDATSGDEITFAVGSHSVSANYAGTLTVVSPSGVQLSLRQLNGTCTVPTGTPASLVACAAVANLGVLKETGRYTVIYVQTQTDGTIPSVGRVEFDLSRVIDLGVQAWSSSQQPVTPQFIGQGWKFEYNAQVGWAFDLSLYPQYVGSVPVTFFLDKFVYATDPQGAGQTVTTYESATDQVAGLHVLPARSAGQYSVHVYQTDSYGIALTGGLPPAYAYIPQIASTAQAVQATIPGSSYVGTAGPTAASAFMTLQGRKGQQISWSLLEASGPSQQGDMYIFGPDGAALPGLAGLYFPQTCQSSSNGICLEYKYQSVSYQLVLPEDGAYSIWLVPRIPLSQSVGSNGIFFTLTLNNVNVNSSTTLSIYPSTAAVSQSVVISATIAGNIPSGTVVFMDGGVQIGSASLNSTGTATISTSFSSPGIHQITANYSGDANNQPSQAAAQSLNVMSTASYQSYIAAVMATIQALLLSDD